MQNPGLRTPHLRKAGRYKLAAPVSKTGSALPRSERYRRLPPFLTTTLKTHEHTHIPISIFHWQSRPGESPKANLARQKPRPASDGRSVAARARFISLRRQSTGLQGPMASLIFNPLNERKSHETRSPISKPVALPKELQTKSCNPNQTAREVESHLPPGWFRIQTANQNV
jgi:hypothetical protein